MTQPAAKVLLDSITEEGDRITTVELTHHRFILAETNTHGAISKNSASSRAIPLQKMQNKFINDPAYPAAYRAEQAGMSAGGDLTGDDLDRAIDLFNEWNNLTYDTIDAYLNGLIEKYGLDEYQKHTLHKSWINRLMEPMQWHTAIWTFDHNLLWNMLSQRDHPDAQPEFYELAKELRVALADSEPKRLLYDQWHMPLLREEDEDDIHSLAEEWKKHTKNLPPMIIAQSLKRQISVARCARVSYMTHDGTRDIREDLRLHDRLANQNPPHASPFEHVCTPAPWNKKNTHVRQLDGSSKVYSRPKIGKFYGWLQMRHAIGMP